MVKTFKKIILSLVFVLVTLTLFTYKVVNAEEISSGEVEMLHELDATTNFFTQVEDKTQIEIVDRREKMLLDSYKLAASNDNLELYFKKSNCSIAVYDKVNGYTWYSNYQYDPDDAEGKKQYENLEALSKSKIESGVTIEFYNVDTKGDIKEAEVSYTLKKNGSLNYSSAENGFDLEISFENYGISFNVEVRIDGSKLKVNVPYESIKEVPVGTLQPKEYKLKSIILFPYFGSQNYKINGYSFIPDGSGALVRYTEYVSSSYYSSKIYGSDYSFTNASTNTYIKDSGVLSLPIYGVNHGYNQAAFLCEVNDGVGSSELLSYPYMYSRIPYNTTFFKYYARDTFDVKLSTNTMKLLNEDPYPTDYSLTYSFLENDKANYVGMAETYRESLGLSDINIKNKDIPLRLELLGIDYKPGLFGKNYVTMTTYNDALDIVTDLERNSIKNFSLTYLGWNRGGYFTKSALNARTALLLGGKSKLMKFSNYIKDRGYSVDYTINPVISSGYGTTNKTVKKIGLSPFEVTQKSSIEQLGYYVAPTEIASLVLKRDGRYNNLGIDSFNIANINAAYSYRYKSIATYRSEMINQVVNEMNKLAGYKLSTERPNSYLLPYVRNYYDAFYESNKYVYETDSIPFMSILLGGSVNQFFPNINYISNYELAVLRMIEYNIYPSFLITKEEAYDLRYTNYEYLNSTQYDLWKSLIVSMYSDTNNALKYVIGAKMIHHEYLLAGVAKCEYSNGVTIYINYNNRNVSCDNISLAPYSYYVKGGN